MKFDLADRYLEILHLRQIVQQAERPMPDHKPSRDNSRRNDRHSSEKQTARKWRSL